MPDVTPPDPLMQIGAFARAAGVTPSMLRFYADCGLVEPARVDPVSGYRRYSPEQVDLVLLVRRLRDIGLPLPEVARTLLAPLAEAEALVRARVDQLEREVRAARVSADSASRLLRRRSGWAEVAAAALAAAVRRVAPAAAGCPEAPVLAGVLVELSDGVLQLVATDRYRLAAQTLPASGPATAARAVLPAAELLTLAGWAGSSGSVGLVLADAGLTVRRDDGDCRQLPALPGDYPDHEPVLAAVGPPATRIAAARSALLDALAAAPVSRLSADPAVGLQVSGTDDAPVTVPATVSGAAVSVAFRRSTLRPAVLASLGPDVVLELASPDAPALVRSADDGTFTTVAMPTLASPSTRQVAW